VEEALEATTASSVDWRTQGVETPVKNQEQCGSCWAFSTIECLESREKLAGKKLVSLSPQELVSCDKVDHGCKGGIMQNGFDFIKQHGIVAESVMP